MADEHELTWSLADPRMDLLERAGLAGLYMSLRAAEEAEHDLSPLRWSEQDLRPDAVTVRWTGPAKPAFEKLMEWSWQVTAQDGVLFFASIHGDRDRVHFHLRVPSHNGVMRTFLQHTNVQPKGEPVTRIVKVDEDKEISVSYQPPIIRVPKKKEGAEARESGPKKLLKPWRDIADLFDRKGAFRNEVVELSNWVYPGIAGRFSGEGAWEGPPQRALLLMLAPTVCLYQRLQGEGGNWIFIIPDVRDLEDFCLTRPRLTLDASLVDVASLGDAGLQFLAQYATRSSRKQLGSGCRVVAMGKVGYYANQSIRKSVLDVGADPVRVARYRLLHRELPNVYVAIPPATEDTPTKPQKNVKATQAPKKGAKKPSPDEPRAAGFIKLPAARGRIADNLVSGRPWYENLFVPQVWDHDEMERQRKRQPGTSLERLWFQAVCYQRSKLMKLIQEEDMWDTEAEKVFVDAFWEALDSLYAQEAAATERGGSRTIADRFEDLTDDIRRRITQAKTGALLRTVLSDLFAKAGRQKTIRTHPAVIWRLIDNADQWRKGRDLALLALASHRRKEDRQLSTNAEKGA